MAELSSCNRDQMGPKGENIYYMTFYSKSLLNFHLGEEQFKDKEGLVQRL